MIINNFKKDQVKILIDIEDLKNAQIPLNDWLKFPEKNLKILFKNIPIFKKTSIPQIYIYSYKLILFYIFLKY